MIFIFDRRILLFPKGNGQHDQMSIYLEVVPEEGVVKDWSICGQFAVVISQPTNPKYFFSNRNVTPFVCFFFNSWNLILCIF